MPVVYLLHFSTPISNSHTCQHYIGSAKHLAERIQQHRLGNGARLTEVAKERGIDFTVVRVWVGGRTTERQLKNRKNAPKYCPVCNPRPYTFSNVEELTHDQIQHQLIGF